MTSVYYFRAFCRAFRYLATFAITVKSIHFLKIVLTSCVHDVDQLIIPCHSVCILYVQVDVIRVASLQTSANVIVAVCYKIVKTQRRVILFLKILEVILKRGTEYSGFKPVGL